MLVLSFGLKLDTMSDGNNKTDITNVFLNVIVVVSLPKSFLAKIKIVLLGIFNNSLLSLFWFASYDSEKF